MRFAIVCIGLVWTVLCGEIGLEAGTPANLPLDERPQWLRREGMVMAGSWETLLYRVRRGRRGNTPPEWEAPDHGRDCKPTPQQLAAWQRETSDEMLTRLKSLGVNFLMIPLCKGAGMKAEMPYMQETARWTKRCHEAGIHVGVYADSSTLLWDMFSKEVPEARDWLTLDKDGKPIAYSRGQPFRYRYSRNHPDAHDYFLKVIKFAVEEAKVDLLHFDNYLWGPGTEADSLARFREYLAKTFSSEQLTSMGVDDLASVQAASTSASGVMLHRAWRDFSCQYLADSYRRRCQYARSLRKDILMECNPHAVKQRTVVPRDHFRLVGHGDAFWVEGIPYGYSGYRDGRLQTRIRSFKVGRLLGNMVFSKNINPLELAESMAFNLDCLGCICFFEYGIIRRRPYTPEGVLPESKPFIRFYNERRDLFRNTEIVADVAVLRSFPSQVFAASKCSALTNRVEQELIENRVPFQIVGQQHLDDLKPYRLLVLAGCPALSDTDLKRIRRYVDSGGTLCIIGPAATHDEWMTPRRQPALDDLPKSRVVRIESPDNFMAAVGQTCGKELSASVDSLVGLCTELTERSDARLLHLVNYREGEMLRDVTVRLRLPPGRRAKTVILASPGRAKDLQVPFESDGDAVTFTVPRIDVYEIAILTME